MEEKKNKNFQCPMCLMVLIIVIVAAAAVGVIFWWQKYSQQNGQVACTQEAMLCPDGSYVSRSGPNCEFAECPGINNKIANWQTYRNEEYGFEVKYPSDWKIGEYQYSLDKFLNIENFFTEPQVHVFNIGLVNNSGNKALVDFAKEEIKNNHCSAQFESTACPEKGPVDHIIKSDTAGILYVTGNCGATSEEYVYLIKMSNGNILRLSYFDDFDNNWCEAQKTTKFNQILSTLKFTK